jgi:hypothetical protein
MDVPPSGGWAFPPSTRAGAARFHVVQAVRHAIATGRSSG